MGTLHQVLGVHPIPFTEKQKNLLAYFAQAVSHTHIVKKSTKTTYSQQHANISQFVQKLIKKLLMVFLMQRKLETIFRGFSL